MWQAWMNGLLGVWLAVAPFTGLGIPSARLNNILTGGIILTVAVFYVSGNSWKRWLNIIAGAWIVTSAFFAPFIEGELYLLNNLISGLLVALGVIALRSTQIIREQE